MNREQLVAGIHNLRIFIDGSLGLSKEKHMFTGFELCKSLLDSTAYNTYLETVGDKADTMYLHIKEALPEMTTYSYLILIKKYSEIFHWKEKECILAFDYTEEDFYGNPQGFGIHGWTGEHGVTGKFKFLTCSIVSDDIPEKIPLISIPTFVGDYKSYAVTHCLDKIVPFIGKIKLILFDRGFYDKDLMYELTQTSYPYLIFVPKQKDKKELLHPLEKGEHVTIVWDFDLNKDQTVKHYEALLTFFKQIYDKKSEKEYDWVFVTNVEEVALANTVVYYKKRWRIETSFRVQDDATIKCKSKEMKIRYFIFVFQQMLQTQWVCFHKNEVSFKEYIIEMQKTCNSLVEHPKRSYGKHMKRSVE